MASNCNSSPCQIRERRCLHQALSPGLDVTEAATVLLDEPSPDLAQFLAESEATAVHVANSGLSGAGDPVSGAHRFRANAPTPAQSSPVRYNCAVATEAADLLTSALALSLRERAKIAHELLLSLDDGSDADSAEAWVGELEQRARQLRSGSVTTEDWETVKARLAERWQRR
jgi:putative addiction module component (TIGR02574 family)